LILQKYEKNNRLVEGLFCVVLLGFLRGFWEKWVFGCGFWMVKTWWMHGKTWWLDGT
jgi:hypothetical protein